MIIRRIRYALAGKIIRGTAGLVRLIIALIVIVILMSGVISQRKILTAGYYLIKSGGFTLAEAVNQIVSNKDSRIVVTDEGIYLKNEKTPGKVLDLTNGQELNLSDPGTESVVENAVAPKKYKDYFNKTGVKEPKSDNNGYDGNNGNNSSDNSNNKK